MSYTNTLRARGGARARGWGCSSSSGRKRDRLEGGGHWKVFLFLPDNILWQVLRGEAAGKGAQEVRVKAVWLWVLLWERGAVWAVRLGVATHWHIAGLCHWKIHSFPVYFSRQNNAQQSPFLPLYLSHSLPSSCHHAPFLAATTLCNI